MDNTAIRTLSVCRILNTQQILFNAGGCDRMKRSILMNPKEKRPPTLVAGDAESLFTRPWRKRLIRLFKSVVPAHTPPDRQIWLDTIRKINDFTNKLDDPDFDLSHVDYIVIAESISDIYDIIKFFSCLRDRLPDHARIIYTSYNFFWSPIFKLGGLIGLSRKRTGSRFYLEADLDTFMQMSGWENVRSIRHYLLPCDVPILSSVFEQFLVRLPIVRRFSLNTVKFARKSHGTSIRDYSVTVLVPCRNEEGNIEAVVKRMPAFSNALEILFINDSSTDKTESRILEMQQKFPEKNIVLTQGKGLGKGEAVRAGMIHATGEICIILDADLTVIPEDLPQFYDAMKLRYADFLHGTRIIYPQERGSMRFLNTIGNMGFAIIFSYIVEQRTTDTLCGTKVYWRRDWPLFEEVRERLGRTDIWGDYNIIFGATHFGLKVAQLPVRYFERLEGKTKMVRRLRNAGVMMKVACYALWRIKFFK